MSCTAKVPHVELTAFTSHIAEHLSKDTPSELPTEELNTECTRHCRQSRDIELLLRLFLDKSSS